MNNRLEMVKGFLATQLNFIPAILIVYIIYFGILKQEPVMWKYAVMAVLPFIFYCIRMYVKKMILFFILHIKALTGKKFANLLFRESAVAVSRYRLQKIAHPRAAERTARKTLIRFGRVSPVIEICLFKT